jgi:ABC-type proline/glycine betaine transport system substrate-binding protein
MSTLRFSFFFVVLALMVNSCNTGSASKTLKKGDIIITLEELRERAETQWEDASYTDGFTSMIPKGTKLQIMYTPARTGFECKPIEVNGIKDADSIEAFFVPEPMRFKEGYKSYSFALKNDYIGAKVKKVD